MTCALLSSTGQIVATNPNYGDYSTRLAPQETAYFSFDDFYSQPQAYSAELNIHWNE